MDKKPYEQGILIEQYKLYVQDVGNIGVRHENTRRFYLSVVSALFVFLSLAGSNEIFSEVTLEVQVLIGVVGVILSTVWRKHMLSFGALYRVKFDVLREIEKEANLYPIYKHEADSLFGDDAEEEIKDKYKFLSDLDSLVPWLFVLVFVVVILLKSVF